MKTHFPVTSDSGLTFRRYNTDELSGFPKLIIAKTSLYVIMFILLIYSV